MSTEIRRRLVAEDGSISTSSTTTSTTTSPSPPSPSTSTSPSFLRRLFNGVLFGFGLGNSFWVSRAVILRFLCVVYFFAFLSAYVQLDLLVGSNGVALDSIHNLVLRGLIIPSISLLPAKPHLENVKSYYTKNGLDPAWEMPNLFWYIEPSGPNMERVALCGMVLAVMGLVGFACSPLFLAMWVIQFSIEPLGQIFYGYGWEIQLIETGFLAIFLAPLLPLSEFTEQSPPSLIVIWLYRFLVCRIMLGAGLIKIRGDSCWRDLTCMHYHYETQPIPNPLSPYLHFSPGWFHKFEVLVNHFVELVVPFTGMLPVQLIATVSGVIFTLFQMLLIVSGNLSFLNWLTIVPGLALLDDRFYRLIVPFASLKARITALIHRPPPRRVGPINNLMSSQQRMNSSFNKYRLVNTYGAFGSVGKVRNEVVLMGTNESRVTVGTKWTEYDFWCKPGNLTKRPCIIAPFQPRLAMSTYDRQPWLIHLCYKLLHGDNRILNIMSGVNPFPDHPPTFIKADLFRYRFAHDTPHWYTRTLVSEYMPPIGANDRNVRNFLLQNRFIEK